MGRNRNAEATETNEAEVQEPTAATEQASAEQTEGTEPEAAATTDLATVTSAAEAALANVDENGVPQDTAGLVESYRALDAKGKKAFREHAQDQARKALMESKNADLARGWMHIQTVVATTQTKTPATPADPTEAFVTRGAAFALASRLVTSSAPEGVDREAALPKIKEMLSGVDLEQVGLYEAWLASDDENKGDEPQVPAFVKVALKIASGKAAKVGSTKASSGGSGVRRDIAEHIRQVFAEVPSGTFLTVAEISNKRSEEYGDDKPSPGAISARLFPGGDASKCTLTFVTPNTNGKAKGATKV